MLKNIKERIKRHQNIDVILNDKKLMIKHTFIIVLLMIIPYIYLSEEVIYNNNNYKYFSDYMVNIFPAIENRALIARENDLYYFCKFQGAYSLLVMAILYLISLYDFSKFYCASLGIMQFKTDRYINQTIQKNKSQIPDFMMYVGLVVFILFMIDFMLYFEISIDDALSSFKAPFQTKFSITLFFSLFTYGGVLLSFITLEMLAKIYNLFDKKE